MHKNEGTFAVDAATVLCDCVDNELKYKIRNGINKQQKQLCVQDLSY